MKTRFVPFLMMLLVCFVETGFAQQNLEGTVVDPSGAAVAAASISLRTTAARPLLPPTASDARGFFRIVGVAPGRYRLHVEAGDAFDVLDRAIVVGSGDSKPLLLQLTIRTLHESLEVVTDDLRPNIDTGANLDKTSVDAATLDELPIFDQDYVGALKQFLDPASIATGGTTITVDGMEVSRVTVPKADVQGISINDDPYSAESSRPGRGRIDIITKPGGGQLHGSFEYAFRNSSLATRSYFAQSKIPEQRQSFEGVISGPLSILRDSSFVFSVARSIAAESVVVHAITPNGSLNEAIPTPAVNTELMTRLSHDWNERQRSALQLNWERSSDLQQLVGGTVLPEAAADSHAREFDLFFTQQSTLSPAALNRFQLTVEVNREATISQSLLPAVIVRDAFAAGGAQATLLRTESGGKLNDIVSLAHGRHSIEFGLQVPNLNRRVYDDRTNQGGTFTFLTLGDYESGHPFEYTVQQGDSRVAFWWREYGAFLQDQINVSPNLHLSLGLRYDWQAFFHDRNNFSPRASLAWAPGDGGKTIVRAGGGLFYDRSGVAPVASLMLHDGQKLRSYTILNPSYPDPLAGGGSLRDLPSNITELAPDIQIPYSFQFGTSVERKLSKTVSVVVGYRGSRGHHLFRSVDVNAPLPPDYTTVADPAHGHVQQIRSDGRLDSDALDLTLRGKRGKVFSGQLQYSWSKAMNDTGGIFWYPSNQYAAPSAEWGPADFDVRHRLNVLATVNEGRWGKFGLVGKFSSALPYSRTLGEDLFHTGLSNARPPGVGRNSLRGSSYSDIDLRWSRDLAIPGVRTKGEELSLSVDAFNVLNHSNFSGYVGNIRSPFYLSPTQAAPGRRIQLSLEAKFGGEE